jgi:hypothetical protein
MVELAAVETRAMAHPGAAMRSDVVYSKNRYRSSVQTAEVKSHHRIFLPAE